MDEYTRLENTEKLVSDVSDKLTFSEKSLIMKEASYIAEKAYRRGFQHGINTDGRIDDDDAAFFRFDVPMNRALGAPEVCIEGRTRNPWKSVNFGLIERHLGLEGSERYAPILYWWEMFNHNDFTGEDKYYI